MTRSEGTGSDPVEIAPGLWRWTAAHPDWRAGAPPESPGDWPDEVGSVLVEAEARAVFIDALVPSDAVGFWAWADRRARASTRVLVLTTIRFHRRSAAQLAERYRAATSRARDALPDGVEPLRLGDGGINYWLPGHRTLVVGDSLLGARGGGLRLCPESWLRYSTPGRTLDDLRARLRPLLELPIERVLVSHGEPALSGGREALAEALR